MENQALSNEPPPDDPDELLLAQMGVIEATIKDGKKKSDHVLLESAKKYLELIRMITSTNAGNALVSKYKIKRRFVLLVLGTVFEKVFAPSKGHPTALATSLLIESRDVLLDDPNIIAELNVLGALFLGDDESYVDAMSHFVLVDKKRALELALSLTRYEDFLYILSKESDPVQLILGLPADPFLGALQSFLLGHQLWRGKVQLLVQKLKGFQPDRLATFSVKLGSNISCKFDEFILQIAVEFGHEESLHVYAIPLLSAVSRSTDDNWCASVPIGVVSDACQLLNSLQGKALRGELPAVPGDYFRYSITLEDLQKKVPSYLASLQVTGKAPITQLIRYNPELSLFTLGRLFIDPPAESTGDKEDISEEEDVVLFKKPIDFTAEFEQLTIRKQHLSTQAMSLPSTHLSFDLTRSAFIIDTNILVASPKFLESFYDLDARVYVPVIVLEELLMLADHPVPEKSSKARAALYWFDSIYKEGNKIKSIFASGRTSTSFDIKNEPDSLGTATNDDLILKICTILGKQQQAGGIVLLPVVISDDVNMRLKAKAMGILAVSLESFSHATFT